MADLLQSFVNRVDQITEWFGRTVSWLTVAMVVVTFVIVVVRYVFNAGSIAVQESVTYMHALVFLIGSAYTLKHAGHVRVDIFYRPASARIKAWVDLFGAFFLLIPVCGFIGWASWDYVSASWSLHEGSREAGGLPGVFLLKSSILLMAALLILQALAESCRSILQLRDARN
jgi:TRAP-type mannitol/chloroaromatic compound transport system permease small subunit